jgi:integrase
MGGRPRLLFSGDTAEFTIGGITPTRISIGGQPILVDGYNNVVWPVTNYLRHLRIFGREQSTIAVYASQLLDYWHFLHDSRLAWDLADDHFLRLWRNHLEHSREIKKSTFNEYLSTVTGFYKYAQSRQFGRDLIGVNDLRKGTIFRITMEIKIRKDGTEVEVSSLRYKTTETPEPYFPPTPVINAITATIATSKRPALAERDLIITEFKRRVALRRIEVLGIRRNQIPDLDEIDTFEDRQIAADSGNDDELVPLSGYPMKIVSAKSGGREDLVYVPPALLRRTREWMDEHRCNIVARRRRTGHLTEDPQELFISSKTGAVLKAQSITNSFKIPAGKTQRAAEKQGDIDPRHSLARPHHLRAEAITNHLVGLLESGMEQTAALFRIQVFARHKRFKSTERYLKLAQMIQEANRSASNEWTKRSNAVVQQRAEEDHRNISLALLTRDLSPEEIEVVTRLIQLLGKRTITSSTIEAILGKFR